MKTWRKRKWKIFLGLLLGLLLVSPTGAASKKEQQESVRQTVHKILERLYKTQPSSRKIIHDAAGYAVFSNFGMKIFLIGGGKGKGLAHNNRTGKDIFMKMVEIQGGLGLGIKKFAVIWVFEKGKVFKEFVDTGVEIGAQYTAAAKHAQEGGALAGAITIRPGVWLYQLTEKGLALDLTIKGTKYYRDSDLN
jgi:lipid-binding SYLF domain-containing protein